MQCIHCKHQVSKGVIVQCSECGRAYERHRLEEYEHIQYLKDWLDTHRQAVGENANALLEELTQQQHNMEHAMGLKKPDIVPVPLTQPVEPAPAPVEGAPQPEPPLVPLMEALAEPEPKPAPQPAPKPATPPPPPKPAFDWNAAWDKTLNFVVSGALLTTLLYLGAFMIVISATVLVVRFWNAFPPIAQVAIVFTLPAIFYGAGWLVRTRIKLEEAGMVLTGVGALLFAVDFAALYQFMNLDVDVNLYWLVTSVIVTALYIFTAIRLRDIFFDSMALLAITSTALAATRVATLQIEWTFAAIPATSAAMVAFALWAEPRGGQWKDASRAARYLPYFLVPTSLIAVLAVTRSDSAAGQACAFLFAAVASGLLAYKKPQALMLGFSLVTLATASWFAIAAFNPEYTWAPTAAAILSTLYIFTGWKNFSAESEAPHQRSYQLTFYWSGFILSGLASLGGLLLYSDSYIPEAFTALTISALGLSAWHLLLRKPASGWMGGLLLLLAFPVAFDWANLHSTYIPLAYLALISLVYLPYGMLCERIEKRLSTPFYWLGHIVSLGILISATQHAINNSYQPNIWLDALTMLLLAGYYTFATLRFKNPLFAWGITLSLPISASIAMAWQKTDAIWWALGWIGLAYLYFFIEYGLRRTTDFSRLAYRLSFTLWAVFLSMLGLAASILFVFNDANDAPLVITSQGLVLLLTILAGGLHRSRWPVYATPLVSFTLLTSIAYSYGIPILGHAFTNAEYGLLWSISGALHLLIAALLDKNPARYSHGLYLGGYALMVWGIPWSIPDRTLLLWNFGLFLAALATSALLVHFSRHHTWNEFANIFDKPNTIINEFIRNAFIWAAAAFFPLWLALLADHLNLTPGWVGLTLTGLAPFYIAAGWLLNRVRASYRWPFYTSGYALTIIGAMLAQDSQPAGLLALFLDVLVYTGSAALFQHPLWLYLASFLLPAALVQTLDHTDHLSTPWLTWTLTITAFAYFGIIQWLNRAKENIGRFSRISYTLPLLITANLLVGTTLYLSLLDEKLAIGIYLAAMLFYTLSAWRFNNNAYIYPAAWLVIVPYAFFIKNYTWIPTDWRGISWLPLILLYIGIGRFVFDRPKSHAKPPFNLEAFLLAASTPFYLLAYALSLWMVYSSASLPLALTVASGAATLLYLGSALLFGHPAWLYPTLLAAHLTVLAYFGIHPTGSPVRMVSLPFMALTWLEVLAGYVISRRYPITQSAENGRREFRAFGQTYKFGNFPSVGYLLMPSWAQPIFIMAALDVLIWESLALSGLDTGLWVSAGYALLFALVATLWGDTLLAHISLGLAATAIGYGLRTLNLSYPQVYTMLTGFGFGLYLISMLVERLQGRNSAWRWALSNMAVALAVLGIISTVSQSNDRIASALTFTFAGATFLTLALNRRRYWVGYFGMGLLLAGWSIFLFSQNIEQPQLYAVPTGLYFAGIGFIERKRSTNKRFAVLIESFGLVVMLMTTFGQSNDPQVGLGYFLLLLAEALAVLFWGAFNRLRVPFLIGLGAMVLSVLYQTVAWISRSDINRWFIIFGVGILLIGLGLYVERRREMLLARARELRDMLEKWD